MKQSLYLHSDISDVLKSYCGTIERAIDDILTEYDLGNIDIENCPQCRPREGANRFNVNITNKTYLQMVELYGVKSKRISIRRLLYWFVEYEIYDELGWQPKENFVDNVTKRKDRLITNILSDLTKLKIHMSKNVMDGIDLVSHATDLISQLRR